MENEREVYNIGTSPIVCMNCKEGHSNESTLLHQNKYSNRNPSSASSLYSNSTTHSMAPSSNWKKSFLFKNVRGSSLADDDLNETNDFNDDDDGGGGTDDFKNNEVNYSKASPTKDHNLVRLI